MSDNYLWSKWHNRGLAFSREHEMDVFYKGVKIGNRRVDFFVEEKVMVEIKNDQENPQYEVQMRKFLKEYL